MSLGMRPPYRPAIGVTSALLVAAGLLGGCSIKAGDTISARNVERVIASRLAGTFHSPLPAVTCPGAVPAQAGTTFECTATVDGQRLAIRGTVTGTHGRVKLLPEAAVVTRAGTEAALSRHLGTALGAGVRLTCLAPALLVANPGRSFECTALVGHSTRRVMVRFTSKDGAFSYRVTP
jgi:hypothetical protein